MEARRRKYDLHQLITNAWEVGSVPQAWKNASIVTIYKKCDRTDCRIYRGISLLSIAGQIFAKILLNRLSTHIILEVVLEPSIIIITATNGRFIIFYWTYSDNLILPIYFMFRSVWVLQSGSFDKPKLYAMCVNYCKIIILSLESD